MRPVLALAVIGGLMSPTPAHAAVKFDPKTMTGFVGAGDVRTAFGWDAAVLKKRAPGVAFRVDVVTTDEYRVVCRRQPAAARTFTRSYVRTSAFHELKVTVETRVKGYAREVSGFRLDGPFAGASSMSILPPAGGPCPLDDAPEDDLLVSADLLSSTERESLSVIDGDEQRELTAAERPAEP